MLIKTLDLLDVARRNLVLQSLILTLCLLWTRPGVAQGTEVSPEWTSDRHHRLLVEVDPVPNLPRATDEMVAQVQINFDELLKYQQVDLSSLQVVAYSKATSKILDFPGNSYATTPGDRPLRFYDASVPWAYKDHEGYAHNTDGQGLPARDMPGGLRFFNAVGDAHSGNVAWAHTQAGSDPTRYAIYFNSLRAGTPQTPAPAGFIGDGSSRSTRESDTFAPVLQGRVAIADLDGDGLFDLLLGNATGTLLWYPNHGSAKRPKFDQARLLFTDNGEAIDVGWSSAPVAADWDHDGDLDLLVCAEKECVVFFRNVGDAKNPKFRHEGLLTADGKALRIPNAPCEEDPGNKIYPLDYYGVPEIADWDGDGDMDLLIGGYTTGRIWYYENIAADAKSQPQLTLRGALQADGKDLDVGWCASPCSVDLDGDGDLDLISGAMQMSATGGDSGSADKFLWYYENVGTCNEPKLSLRKFPAKGTFSSGALAAPKSIDFTEDGLPDLIVSVNGQLAMLPNIGTKGHPLFDAATRDTGMPWGKAQLGFNQLVDYNNDGWPDLFFRLSAIQLNDGSGAPGKFDRVIPLSGAEKILHPSPMGDHWDYRTLGDVDGDGNADILVGDHQGFVWFHRNNGTSEHPQMDVKGVKLEMADGKPMRVGLPPADVAAFDVLQGARTAVTTGDFNHDGKTDVVACDTFGYLRVFDQVPGNQLRFELAHQTAKLEPTRMTAQRVDWNGDGRDDLIAAYANDRIYVLVNRAIDGKPQFEQPRLLDVPRCFGDPWPFVGDWNHDGDADLIIDQYGYTRFVERSFIEYGYRPAHIMRFEDRPEGSIESKK